MMYRRNAAQTPRTEQISAASQMSFMDGVTAAVRAMLQTVYEVAHRENRQRDRGIARKQRHTTYQAKGLNGDRALARRRRQIAAGSLTASNGLVV